MNDVNEKQNQQTWWWLAINQDSCAASAIASADVPTVIPAPEFLLGFRSKEEQLESQEILLTNPLPQVKRYMQTLEKRSIAGEIKHALVANPEPPTRGGTHWVYGG